MIAATAARHLVAAAADITTVRWWQRGFSSPTRRNLMGQVDGTANLAVEDPLFDEVVWSADTQPEWLRGGSYVAVRRIRMDLDAWNAQSVEAQEAVIGRFKDSGAPLNGTKETDPVDLSAQTPQRELIIRRPPMCDCPIRKTPVVPGSSAGRSVTTTVPMAPA